MCGRYYRRSDKQKIAEAFRTGVPTTFEILPSYNVAPQTFQPVVCFNRKTLERELVQMRWGLVPYWAKDAKVGYSTINAKAETLTTSPAFREAIKRRRCLIPADGFFEWQWKSRMFAALHWKSSLGSAVPRLPHFVVVCRKAPFACVLANAIRNW